MAKVFGIESIREAGEPRNREMVLSNQDLIDNVGWGSLSINILVIG